MKVLIVGAGFAGLTLAAYLQRDGHKVTLVEKKEDHEQAGFVIGLWSNGRHTLEPFHVLERLSAVSIPVTREFLRDKTGKIMATIDYRSLIERYGAVFQVLHSDVQKILRELVTDVRMRFETSVIALDERAQSVIVTLSDGTQEEFDLVVGADGIHSHIRTLLFGNEGFTYSGLRIWISMLPYEKAGITEPNDLFGEGEYVGLFPTRNGKLGTLFLAAVPEGQPDLPEQRIAYLKERFSDFTWVVPDILQSLQDPAEIFCEDIDQVSLDTWYRGRVVLLGDAAHAVSPTAAMGGAMALEDAHVLAEELRLVDAAHVEQALVGYMTRRKPRVDEIRHTSDFLIWLAGIQHPAMAFVRNTVIHLLPSRFLLKDMEEILEIQA
ncbi:MAG TPA: NAD(P)/FAD-dependent oxidoreductase [Ktedonobacteraceae bacterium]